MKIRPIIFNGQMVRAILDGRKTQTRRVVKPQPYKSREWAGGYVRKTKSHSMAITRLTEDSPFGQPGDKLWVREAFGFDPDDLEPYYKASENNPDIFPKGFWRPSIHMPRGVFRITLEITDVRVERVRDISLGDIIAEGVCHSEEFNNEICMWRDSAEVMLKIRRKYFKRLWDSINEKRGSGWKLNPWVWVIEFKRINND